MSASSKPQRPAHIPQGASWDPTSHEWGFGTKNAQGAYVGEWKWWLAPDGHLCCNTFFDDSGNMISFKRFHPNGEVSREGTFENGVALSDVYYRSTGETNEVFADNNENPHVWKAVKRNGVPVTFDYFDKQGNHLNPVVKKSTLPIANIDQNALFAEAKNTLKTVGQRFTRDVLESSLVPKITELLRGKNEEDTEFQFISLLEDLLRVEGDNVAIYCKGDIKINDLSNFEKLGIRALIVDGNLDVDMTINLSEDPKQLLFVTGNVTAKNIVTAGDLIVTESVTVSSCVIGDYNHGSTRIFGDLRARFFYPEEYFFGVDGGVHFTYAFGNPWRLNENTCPEVFNYNDVSVGDFLNLLHPDIRNNIDLSVTAYLAEPCKDGGVWMYIDRYQFIQYVQQCQPVFDFE